MLKSFIQQLERAESLDGTQVAQAVRALVDPDLSPEIKADFLVALAKKGETVEEIIAFATELRSRAITPPIPEEARKKDILDVCGTGGDRLNTFNISTAVALIAAAGGIQVAKHGNRAVTSQSGSADVLEALGIPTELGPEEAAQSLARHQFAFFFAPLYHPTFKAIGPVRRLCAQRGFRTIFNFLGPLLNPARPSVQLVGVPQPGLCEPLALVLKGLGLRRGMVISGRVARARTTGSGSPPAEELFLDEFSTLDETWIAEFYQDRGLALSSYSPEPSRCQPASLADLAGGNPQRGAAIIEDILHGRDCGPRRDAVLLNAAAALLVADAARSIEEGWDLAAQIVDSGEAVRKLQSLRVHA